MALEGPKAMPRNATLLLELLSSAEDFGTFAAYMAGEAKALRGGYGTWEADQGPVVSQG